MSEFYDTTEYCGDHEEAECEDRKKAVQYVLDRRAREEREAAAAIDGRIDIDSDDFAPCESKGLIDCEMRWDRKLNEYVKREEVFNDETEEDKKAAREATSM